MSFAPQQEVKGHGPTGSMDELPTIKVPEVLKDVVPEILQEGGETALKDLGIEQKRAVVTALEDRLGVAATSNEALGNQAVNELIDLGVDEAAADPAVVDAVHKDTNALVEQLPAVAEGSTKQLAEAARAFQADFAKTTADTEGGLVAKAKDFCQKRFGATLGETAQVLAESVLPTNPNLDAVAKLLKGERVSARDAAQFGANFVAPPLGKLAYDLLFASDEQTRGGFKKAAQSARFRNDVLKLVVVAAPEAAFLVAPADVVMRGVADELEVLSAKEGKVTVWDQAKAIGRGIIPKDKEKRREMVQGLVKVVGSKEAMSQIGIGEDGQAIAALMTKAIEKNPDKVGDVMMDAFAK